MRQKKQKQTWSQHIPSGKEYVHVGGMCTRADTQDMQASEDRESKAARLPDLAEIQGHGSLVDL